MHSTHSYMQNVTTNMQTLLRTTAHGMLQLGIDIQVPFKQNGAKITCHNEWKQSYTQQSDGMQISETAARDGQGEQGSLRMMMLP